jgi:hypothetical protein
VPVNDREAKVLLHRFPVDDLFGIVMLEIEGITRLGTAILDLGYVGEKLGHRKRLARTVRQPDIKYTHPDDNAKTPLGFGQPLTDTLSSNPLVISLAPDGGSRYFDSDGSGQSPDLIVSGPGG